MQSLTQARRKNTEAGEPLHLPFGVLRNTKTLIRRGQLTLIAGGPGTGKSAIVQSILQRGDDKGSHNSVLYFSADSDSGTMFKRSACIATGYEQDDVEAMVEAGEVEGLEAEVNAATRHQVFDYRSSPSPEDIMLEVEAYLAVYGTYPEAIVVDNLKNLFIDVEGEFQALEAACEFMHDLARDTNAAVITLHHVVGNLDDGLTPIPLSGLRGKVSKTPEVVLTLHRSENHLNVSPVKNRNGKAQADGKWVLPIYADMARMAYSG